MGFILHYQIINITSTKSKTNYHPGSYPNILLDSPYQFASDLSPNQKSQGNPDMQHCNLTFQ